MSPFMRRIASLKALKTEGIDQEFFREGDLIEIPDALAERIENWCKKAEVANTSLPSKGATSDEPLDVYYIQLATKAGQGELRAMLKDIADPLVEAVNAAAGCIKGKTAFTADSNRPFDDIMALSKLRDNLMACAAKPARAEGDDVTLVIYV